MQKQPEDRFASTAALVTALDACLAPFDEDTLSDLVPDKPIGVVPGPRVERRRPTRRRRAPVFGLLVGLLLAVGLAGLGYAVFGDDGNDATGSSDGNGGAAAEVTLRAASDYDPEGDDTEHPEAVGAATDGDPTSFWTTETYGSFDKAGVGIVVRASAPVDGGTVVVRSDGDSGYTAEIRAATRRDGDFEPISESQTVGRRTTFELDTGGEEYRFLLVWITELGPSGRAHVNEVALRS
jgi:hypothetical protein